MGDNIPGKKREILVFLGGVPMYKEKLEECKAKEWDGFELQ